MAQLASRPADSLRMAHQSSVLVLVRPARSCASLLVLLAVAACGSLPEELGRPSGSPSKEGASAGGNQGSGNPSTSEHGASAGGSEQGTAGAAGAAGALEDDVGWGGDPGASPEETALPKEPVCDPETLDDPDDDFIDSNCDGIDGDSAAAVFVAPGGNDLGSGSMEDPLASINAGIRLADEQGKDVYVCNGSYDGAVVYQGESVSLFGGYDCENSWQRVKDWAEVRSAVGIPLVISGVTDVRIERLAFVAASVTTTEGSSYAAMIQDSTGVQLRRVQLESAAAGPGKDGAHAKELSVLQAPAGADGTAACSALSCTAVGQGGDSLAALACEGGGKTELGGFGGDGAPEGGVAQAGLSSQSGAKGGVHSTDLALRDGKGGTDGNVGATGSTPDRSLGQMSDAQYLPSNQGGWGAYGRPGGGGGGGAGGPQLPWGDQCCSPGHGGSQGGLGGCGGKPGQGGTGGGASIALVVVRSEVTLERTRLLSGDGGQGGRGGAGGPGQYGGAPGDVFRLTNGSRTAGLGGEGGDGGPGGAGGPGGGGPSLGLALVGSPVPVMAEVQVIVGNPGFGGPAAPTATAGVDGPDGVALSGYDFTTEMTLSF